MWLYIRKRLTWEFLFSLFISIKKSTPVSRIEKSEFGVTSFQFFSFHSHFSACRLSIWFDAKLDFISIPYAYFVPWSCSVKKKITAFVNIEENSRRNYGTCPQVQQQDGSIDPSRLSSRRSALSIPRNLRYFYTMSSTNNSALSLRDFGRKFCRASPSTLTPALLDFKNRARSQIFTIFFRRANKIFFG